MQVNPWAMATLFICSVSSAQIHAEAPPPSTTVKTLVMPFTARRGVTPTLANTMTEVAVTTLGSSSNRNVLGQSDIVSALELEAGRQAINCDSSACFEEIAAAMDVDTLITGSIDQVGDRHLVLITELDAREVKQIARVQGTSTLDVTDLLRVVTELAEELLVKTSGKIQLFGQIELHTVPSGVPVHIGNRDMGLSPITADLPIGSHRVRIAKRAPDQLDAVFDVIIQRKKTTKTQVQLSVPQKVPMEVQETYRADWLLHIAGAGSKGCVGLPLCFLGSYVSTVALVLDLMWAISIAVNFDVNKENLGLTPNGSWGLIYVTGGSLLGTGLCMSVALCGVGLLGWGVSDLFSFPEEPLPGVPQHHILITPPDGEPITLTLPAREETMAH